MFMESILGKPNWSLIVQQSGGTHSAWELNTATLRFCRNASALPNEEKRNICKPLFFLWLLFFAPGLGATCTSAALSEGTRASLPPISPADWLLQGQPVAAGGGGAIGSMTCASVSNGNSNLHFKLCHEKGRCH